MKIAIGSDHARDDKEKIQQILTVGGQWPKLSIRTIMLLVALVPLS
jgi:hypothetical protein